MKNFNVKALSPEQKKIRERILEISYQEKLSHLGSCFSSVDLIDGIYKIKDKDEKFILSNGHAGIALYAVLEKNGHIKNPETIKHLYVHPDRNPEIGIDVSTGSLGQGLPIALGIALSNKNKNVYCLISDGECAEGSVWETLRITHDHKITNLKIVVNANGWSAYDSVNLTSLAKKLRVYGFKIKDINGNNIDEVIKALREVTSGNNPTIIFARTFTDQFPCLRGQDSHYHVMTNKDYQEALDLLE